MAVVMAMGYRPWDIYEGCWKPGQGRSVLVLCTRLLPSAECWGICVYSVLGYCVTGMASRMLLIVNN